jgi:acetylornithine/N-succinyldiaminopimelate aminotransferase
MITPVLPTYNRAPIAFVKGEGSWLTAEDGSRSAVAACHIPLDRR